MQIFAVAFGNMFWSQTLPWPFPRPLPLALFGKPLVTPEALFIARRAHGRASFQGTPALHARAAAWRMMRRWVLLTYASLSLLSSFPCARSLAGLVGKLEYTPGPEAIKYIH